MIKLSLLLLFLASACAAAPDSLDKALFEHYVLYDWKAAASDYDSFLSSQTASMENQILEKARESYQKLLSDQEYDSSPAYGDSALLKIPGNPLTLNPLLAGDDASQEVIPFIFEWLLFWWPGEDPAPGLVDSWEISADRLECILHLRNGVKWHDGFEFSAEDVVFTYRMIMDPEFVSYYWTDLSVLESMEILDSYTVRAKYFGSSSGCFPQGLTFPVLPKHLLEGKNPAEAEFFLHPVGTGPFRFGQWLSDEQIVLDSFKDYYRGRPFLNHLILKIVPDDSAAFLMMLRDELDLKLLTPDQYLKQANSDEFRAHFRIYSYPTDCKFYCLEYFMFSPPLNDKKIRQALARAVDLREIKRQVFQDKGRINTSPFLFADWAYDESVKPYPFDPKAAADILAAAGWKDADSDGVLERGGIEFTLEVVIVPGDPINRFIAEMIRDYWIKIGVSATIAIPGRESRTDVLIGSWAPGDDQYDLWHSSSIPMEENGYSGCNLGGYANPEVDRLLELMRATNPAEKDKVGLICKKLQTIIHEDQPVLFICAPDDIWAVNRRFRGVSLEQGGGELDYSQLYVPMEFQKYSD
ncbi:MAG: ABC transporter substrate-binding protein [Candidatus Wallbacteria bacterium]|nr:ABC transporter substrate-binding protein [Candidatus Wallbacteria bacterium]